jgi:hypothetical protein
MEMDRSIALLARAAREEREREEQRGIEAETPGTPDTSSTSKTPDTPDTKESPVYTREELMEGIRKGQVMFDGLSISFTEREILCGAWRFPWMEGFFDTEREEKDCVFWSCKEWAVSMILALGDCTGEQPSMEEWIQGAVDVLKDGNLYPRLLNREKQGDLEYFSYSLPTAGGRTYSIGFRWEREGKLLGGTFTCMDQDREWMGVLLEAVLLVMEERNRGGE